MPIPVLETERLRLVAPDERHFEAYLRMLATPEVGAMMGGVADRAAAWRNLALVRGHWALRGYGLWLLERKADGVFVGRAGLWRPEGWPELEVGYTLAPEHWGHGYATEAARASLRFAREVLGATRVISVIRPDNVASQRVARRLGATLSSEPFEHAGHRHDLWVYPP